MTYLQSANSLALKNERSEGREPHLRSWSRDFPPTPELQDIFRGLGSNGYFSMGTGQVQQARCHSQDLSVDKKLAQEWWLNVEDVNTKGCRGGRTLNRFTTAATTPPLWKVGVSIAQREGCAAVVALGWEWVGG